MTIRVELNVHDLRQAITEWMQKNKPEVIKGHVISVLIDDKIQATVVLQQAPDYTGGGKD